MFAYYSPRTQLSNSSHLELLSCPAEPRGAVLQVGGNLGIIQKPMDACPNFEPGTLLRY